MALNTPLNRSSTHGHAHKFPNQLPEQHLAGFTGSGVLETVHLEVVAIRRAVLWRHVGPAHIRHIIWYHILPYCVVRHVQIKESRLIKCYFSKNS